MDRVLTDWQKAVNTIAHALNKAGFEGDSPESKALELLAGRCESLTDSAWEIERLRDVLQQQMKNVGELKQYLHNTRSELDKVKGDKDGAYTERNRLVAFIASLFPSQRCKTDIEGWDPEWHGCVFIETPAGQLSWHFHDSDAGLFDHVPYGSPVWDGHTTPEKYERVKSLINIRALTDSPAEIERLNQIIAENRTKNWNVINHKKEIIAALRSELDKVKGERSNLREFAESLFDRMWGYSDVDDQDIDTYAKQLGILVTVPATEEFLQEWGRDCTTMDVPAWSDLARAALSGGSEKEGEDHGSDN